MNPETPITGTSPPLTLTRDVDPGKLVGSMLLEEIFRRELPVLKGDSWLTDGDLDDAGGERIFRMQLSPRAGREDLVRFDRSVAHLILEGRHLRVGMAAPDEETADEILELLKERLPEAVDTSREVGVRFWWWRNPGGTQDWVQKIPALEWEEMSGNYSATAARAVTEISAWRERPPEGGRLLLWYGPPGTGKTTALRSLAWSWRSWARFHFITDPEAFLSNTSYLMQALQGHSVGRSANGAYWQILVLEDAGEFLAPDAKQVAGQALSRLLNVCDGVLGQATRTLILVTTNEPLKTLHPALARPGRCLSEIEFPALSAREVREWCDRHGIEPPGSGPATLADLYATLEGRQAKSFGEDGFGFGAALAA